MNTTRGGQGALAAIEASVGVHQPSTVSTARATLSSWVAVASRKSSTFRRRGSAPWNSGVPTSGDLAAGFCSQRAPLLIARVCGLNWKVTGLPILPPGMAPGVFGGS